MKIALVGAIDRYNYGDLLFPMIVEKELMRRLPTDVEFEYFGSTEADMRPSGGFLCKSLSQLDSSFDVIIFVGGETLTASWADTYIHLQTGKLKVFVCRFLKKVFSINFIEKISKRALNYEFMNYPWTFRSGTKNIKTVIYNTVSGTQEDFYSNISKNYLEDLQSSSYISVRDSLTYRNLKDIGVEDVYEYPDSAYIMSDIYPKTWLQENASKEIFEQIDGTEYIVFQIGKKFSNGNLSIIEKELTKILESEDLKLVLLPIGKAALHEDNIPLKKLYSVMNRKKNLKSKILLFDVNIFETMYVISHSKLFIGTSLHGNITALTYNVPTVAIDKRIGKLTEFLKDYSVPDQEYSVQYDQIFISARKAMKTPEEKLAYQSKFVKKKVSKNFDNISKVIMDGIKK
ncbi:polysaccharide pyruvyl transferase family protein [Enterococcus sp. AZ109]|uniref:polysaccharide pyruvyl transferase family protein n=1 Tax=Enterococcus sp. AZ109 TaxID=2774634 RepID=UPI003F21AC6E